MLRKRPEGSNFAQAESQGAFPHNTQWIMSNLRIIGSL
jgi:hypothetical protein